MAGGEQTSIDLARHRDMAGRRVGPWARRSVLAVFGVVAVVALSGAIGQRAGRDVTTATAAKLEVSSPGRLRGGLYYQSLITVRARRTIQHPQLVFDRGWFDGLTINTIEPQPTDESPTGGGGVAFQYGKLDAGDVLRVWLEYQVNPTTVTRRNQVVELDDAARRLAVVRHRLTVLP